VRRQTAIRCGLGVPTVDGDAVGVPGLVQHQRHLPKVVAVLEGDEVDFGAAFLGRRALDGPFGDDVKLVAFFALGDHVLALREGLFDQR
jgi:hypothetical protein